MELANFLSTEILADAMITTLIQTNKQKTWGPSIRPCQELRFTFDYVVTGPATFLLLTRFKYLLLFLS